MPPGGAHVKTSFIIVYSGVTAFEKNLRVCNFCPGFPIHFQRWRSGFKVAFYFIGSHSAKINKNAGQAREEANKCATILLLGLLFSQGC